MNLQTPKSLEKKTPKDLDITYHTFGCKVNTYDTGLIQKNLKDLKAPSDYESLDRSQSQKSQNGHKGLSENKTSFLKTPHIHILNTCAVTRTASKEAVKLTKKIKKNDPNAFVVVTGCSAQIDKEMFDLSEAVDLLVGNSHKEELKSLIQKKIEGVKLEKFYHKNIFKQSTLGEGGGLEESHSRAFLKIQDGCNSFCSFCVIPHTRGLSRSLELDSLIKKVNEFILMGKKEVVLTGIHLGDYEDSKGNRLEEMVAAVLDKTTLPRLRLTSLEPLELTDKILELSTNPRFCSHFHMSVQSVHTKILKRMKRTYTKEDVLESFKRAKSINSDTFIGMDIIVGFPGETDEDFLETYEALKNSPHWDRIHVFPYSERPKTGALKYKADTVPVLKRKERSRLLRELSHKRFTERGKAKVGKTLEVLVLENKSNKNKSNKNQGHKEGLSQNYWPVLFKENTSINASGVLQVKILDFDPKAKSFGALIC